MIYAFWLAKGGTGKTTLATNVAYLSEKRTILIDADPQGNASSYLLNGLPGGELVGVLSGQAILEGALTMRDHLTILPTMPGSTLKQWSESQLMQTPYVFDDLNKQLKSLGYDQIIYDLGPGLSMLERCILLSVDEVVSPVLAESFSVTGVSTALESIKEIAAAYRTEIAHRRIVVNMINGRFRRHEQALKEYREMEYLMYEIPQDARLAEAQYMGQPLAIYAPKAKSLPEIRRLAKEME